tara:strand:+ start:24 stop:158 length:135 start_codon:yes stop_codon:yes gene_type:complete
MHRVTKDDEVDDFEDFGYTIKNRNRLNKRKIPKYKKESNSWSDT